MQQQKNRSRAASVIDAEDWVVLNEDEGNGFVGYDNVETESKVVRYRKTNQRERTFSIGFKYNAFLC